MFIGRVYRNAVDLKEEYSRECCWFKESIYLRMLETVVGLKEKYT